MPKNGTITITDDDIQASGDPAEIGKSMERAQAEGPGLLSKAQTGLISPDQVVKWATSGKESMTSLAKRRDQEPTLSEKPGEAFSRVFHTGFTSDLAKTASSLTSPVALGTAGMSAAAKLPGVAGKIARALLTTSGLGYGAAGAGDIGAGISEGIKTPGGSQKVLAGASQVLGAAPAVSEAGRVAKGTLAHMVPQAFAEGESAFIRTLQPDRKAISATRSAYKKVAPEMAGAPIKDLNDLHNFSEIKRVQAANELNQALSKINPQATTIDAVHTATRIRSAVNKTLELSSPKEATAIRLYANRVEQELIAHPIHLGEAELMVQELNARSSAFDKLPPEAQRQAMAEGSPILGEKILKQALQDQIESKLSNYRDIKSRYGAWKEIQNQSQAQIDRLEKQGVKPTWLQKRAVESAFGLGGAIFGAHGYGGQGGLVGGALGYAAGAFAAEQLLNKLSRPERVMQRAINPKIHRPLPFAGQMVQPVAGSLTKDEQ